MKQPFKIRPTHIPSPASHEISVTFEVPQDLFFEVVSHANIGHWCDLNKTERKADVFFIHEGDEDVVHELDYFGFVRGIARIFQDECAGKYNNKWHNTVKLLSEREYDAGYADDILQYALFGKLVYC